VGTHREERLPFDLDALDDPWSVAVVLDDVVQHEVVVPDGEVAFVPRPPAHALGPGDGAEQQIEDRLALVIVELQDALREAG
jgi:hypothetical protein